MTGCALASEKGGLGVRLEDGDGDGRPECVAYSDGDSPAIAQARCTKIDAPDARTTMNAFTPSGIAAAAAASATVRLSLPVMGNTAINGNFRWTAATCPNPFRLTSCSCFSEFGNCLGARFTTARLPPGQGEGGMAAVGGGGSAGYADVCNATQVLPESWWRAGAEAHALCVWIGAQDLVMGLHAQPAQCPDGTGPSTMPDKSLSLIHI